MHPTLFPIETTTDRECLFSPCRKYRYSLWRSTGNPGNSYVAFIGLNPSTADEYKNDPMIRRCIWFAKDWGYAELCMLNLFGYRATQPEVMRSIADPIGVDNDQVIRDLASQAALVIAAWGVDGSYWHRDEWAKAALPRLHCLGLTKEGMPRHPLYVKADVKPLPFSGE